MTSVLESGSFKGFGAAFASGFVSSIVSSSIESLGQTGVEKTEVINGKNVSYAELNSFGKSDWFKASMIASGGVSGGFSSMIAGGNFMDGFRQGIIVSGLNHVATMTGEAIGNSSDSSISNSKYDSLSDKQKSKYTQVPKDAIVEKIVQNIPTLSSNTMVPDVVITDTTEVWGETMWVSKKNLYRSIESSVQLATSNSFQF